MLRLFAPRKGGGVREDVDSMVPMDSAKLASGVAREARVPSRMDVAGTYALSDGEARRHRHFPPRRFTLRDHSRNGTRNKRGCGLGRAWHRLAPLSFPTRDQAAF